MADVSGREVPAAGDDRGGRPPRRRARLIDVAERAGVSFKTVSNVVHGYEHVSPAMRAKVQEAIEALDYRPNLSARNLRQGRAGVIAVALPDLRVPYFAELASALVDAAQEAGCTLLVDQTNGRRDAELLAAEGLGGHLIDGMILSPLALRPEDLRDRPPGMPLVLLGEHGTAAFADHVAIDNVAAAAEATRHLLGLGRRRIALLGAQPPGASRMASLREQGFRLAHREAGVPVDERLVVTTSWFLRDDGAAGMARLLDGGAGLDAVVGVNDLLAIGAMRTLADRGVAVPDDVAVVGFDDIEESLYQRPALTTVSPDKRAIARQALQSLLTRVDSDAQAPLRDITVPYRLVVRGSTLAPVS